MDAAREFLSGLDGAGIGGGRLVADWTVLSIDADRSEYTSQFDFAGVGRLAFNFADPALGLLPDYWDAGAVDFHVNDGDRRTEWNRQIELEAAKDFGLFEPYNLGADLLGLTLYGFGGYLQPGQQF